MWMLVLGAKLHSFSPTEWMPYKLVLSTWGFALNPWDIVLQAGIGWWKGSKKGLKTGLIGCLLLEAELYLSIQSYLDLLFTGLLWPDALNLF